MADVYEEMGQIMSRYKINPFLSKPVQRKYAFDKTDVPEEVDVLKIKYSGSRSLHRQLRVALGSHFVPFALFSPRLSLVMLDLHSTSLARAAQ